MIFDIVLIFKRKSAIIGAKQKTGNKDMTYEEAYKNYRKRIESFCQYRLNLSEKSLAEDLTSEIFVLLYIKWESLDSHEEARVLKWLYNAALIKVREHHRLASKKPLVHSWEDYNGAEHSQCEAFTYLDTQADDEATYQKYLEQIKAHLNEKDRKTFELRVEKQYTIAQIAKELNANEVTIKVRWYRIQQKLKEKIYDFLK